MSKMAAAASVNVCYVVVVVAVVADVVGVVAVVTFNARRAHSQGWPTLRTG